MSTDLELRRKNYKSDTDIMNKWMNDMDCFLDIDRTGKGSYTLLQCGDCDVPLIGLTP